MKPAVRVIRALPMFFWSHGRNVLITQYYVLIGTLRPSGISPSPIASNELGVDGEFGCPRNFDHQSFFGFLPACEAFNSG